MTLCACCSLPSNTQNGYSSNPLAISPSPGTVAMVASTGCSLVYVLVCGDERTWNEDIGCPVSSDVRKGSHSPLVLQTVLTIIRFICRGERESVVAWVGVPIFKLGTL